MENTKCESQLQGEDRLNSRVILPLTIALLFTGAVRADESSIKIGELLGDHLGAKISPAHSHSVSAKKSVFWGDVIETSSKGSAELVLFPKFVLTLAPSSKIKIIGNLIWKNGSAVMSEGAISLLKGALHAKLDHPEGTKQTMKIIAPRSVSSIRGTELFVSTDDGGSKIFVKEGTVQVKDLHGDNENSVTAGTGIKLKSGAENEKMTDGSSLPLLPINATGSDQDWKDHQSDLIAAQSANFEELKGKYDKEFEKAVEDIEKEASQTTKEMQSEFDDFMKE
jgi:hypothetical protein